MRILIYEAFKRKFNYLQNPTFLKSFLCAGIGGSIGILFATPGDILKIRLINDLDGVKYKGVMDCAIQTFKASGNLGFLKGLPINLVRSFIWNATELSSYEVYKSILVRCNFNKDNVNTHFLAGSLAGITGVTVVSPIEVTKNRYINQLHNEFQNSRQCFKHILQNEGISAFYKGYIPFTLMQCSWTIIFFVVYEKLKYYSGRILLDQ